MSSLISCTTYWLIVTQIPRLLEGPLQIGEYLLVLQDSNILYFVLLHGIPPS